MENSISLEPKYSLTQDIIYKYTSLNAAEIIIATSTLRFSNPKEFNDPFDCDENILDYDIAERGDEVKDDIDKLSESLYKANQEELKGISLDAFKKRIEEWPKLIEGYKKSKATTIKNTYLCCFSNTYKSPLMWSHYSDKHKGVCLAFNLKIGVEHIFINKKINGFGRVDYDRSTKINYFKNKVEAIAKLLLTKSKDWSYEEEVRMIMLNEKGLLQFNKDFLSGVIFGCRVTDEQIEEIRNLCARHEFNGLNFARAKKADFELEFEHI